MPDYKDPDRGVEKISASFAYGCAYKLPMIVPSKYLQFNKTKKPYIYTYNGKESLKKIILDLINKDYSIEKVKEMYRGFEKEHNFDNINKKINKIID